MEYTLKFNEAGKLNGWQQIHYTLCGCSVRESQKFDNGEYCEWSGFISVHMAGSNYSFMAKDWGTYEIARDASEKFTCDGWAAYQTKNEAGGWDIKPAIEEFVSL